VNGLAVDTGTILKAVEDRFGIRFTETGTGGGCMALQARLESGHWIVATDDALCSLRERLPFESVTDCDDETRPLGWSVGIYPHGDDETGWFGTDSLVDVCDYDAYGPDLPEIVGRALAELARTR
jgi:hypothetical protein